MVKFRLQAFFLGMVLLVWLQPGSGLGAGVTARVDQSVITEGETLRLTLSIAGQQGRLPQPDLTPLEKDFQILGSSSESNVRIINGHVESMVGLTITLLPQRLGRLTIPALTVAGMKTAPLAIEVVAAGSQARRGAGGGLGGGGGGRGAGGAGGAGGGAVDTGAYFLEAEVDTKTPYVQGQVVLQVRFYRAVVFTEGEITEPVIEDAVVERLGEDRASTTEIKGRTYEVMERRYAVFPQKSGPLTLPGLVFQGQMRVARSAGRDPGGTGPFANDPFFQNFFGRDPFAGLLAATRPVKLRSEPIQLDVRPRPAEFVGPWWLPAAQITLSEEGLHDPVQIRVGDPLTRTVRLHAKGLAATQLPEIAKPRLDGVNIYPDQPVIQSQPKGKWILGEREEKWAMVATRPGTYTLPAIDIPWWDVTEERAKVAQLPSRTLTVLPAAGGTTASGGASAVDPPATSAASGGSPPLVAAPLPDVVPPGSGKGATGSDAASVGSGSSGASTIPGVAADPAATTIPGGQVGSAGNPAAGGYWPWVAGGLLLAWLATLGLWWRLRQHTIRSQTPGSNKVVSLSRIPPPDLAPVREACAIGDPRRIADALLYWASLTWPENPPRSLGALRDRLDPANSSVIMDRLERGLYAPETPWDDVDLWSVLQPLLTVRNSRSSAVQPDEVLPSLNPEYRQK
ncbi:MAG: protein BatD [Magnetococcales bacterium]|nr:protein BatD [Magnetococcales bacterium]